MDNNNKVYMPSWANLIVYKLRFFEDKKTESDGILFRSMIEIVVKCLLKIQ